jgi:hypothetical protein
VPFLFTSDDFTDIGIDYGAPVTEDYETPQGHFTGEISWVRIDIGKEAFSDPAGPEEALPDDHSQIRIWQRLHLTCFKVASALDGPPND